MNLEDSPGTYGGGADMEVCTIAWWLLGFRYPSETIAASASASAAPCSPVFCCSIKRPSLAGSTGVLMGVMVSGDTAIAVRREDCDWCDCDARSRNEMRLDSDLGDLGDVMPSCLGEDGTEDCRMKEEWVRDTLDSSRTSSLAVPRRSSNFLWNTTSAMRSAPRVTVAI